MKASKKTKSLSSPAAVQKDVYNLPSHNALAQILSDHHTLLSKGKHEPQTTAKHNEPNERTKTQHGIKPNINHTYQLLHPHKRCPLCVCECAPCLVGFTNLQTEELENYRSAMSRMAEDMITLRTQVMTLETENVQLRADVSLHKDVGRGLLEDTDVDVMTKAEMADRIATLRFKLANETNKTTSQRDKIQQLQNELIRKNELLKLPKDQRSVLAKMAPSEETVKQQEKGKQKSELQTEGSKKKHGLFRTSTTILHNGPGVGS
ncbi:uncharacterized protein ccdc33 isoform X1 [Gouania willdenowi]|uniref:Uncharacterized protein n=1 Tax=Gouania willdenowi TaxID=441366 RepID=A0A8C5N1A6_GOUWI|nr:coiled-coil domain-containing protein 33 isoform X1 [Gouania willdenowi]XP_028306733.1 coiled-coil domain-containing protein 33 isoform X1 [Gouania willdenowi]XP_028306734.1 coiled-coil domain-containing protein 33 isoform X1 [Gouania willdenowi]